MDKVWEAVRWFYGQWWGIVITVVVALALVCLLYKPFFKRFFDILLSGLALIILSPVYIIVTILVKKKLGSPVTFRQYRPGKKNKIFRLHKYRTMTEERDENGNLLPDEVRLTPFGKKLRSTSLDELPEIWDIFRGKMSIIGPRPQLVKNIVFLDERTIHRQDVRPGLTGLAQVHGRNNQSWDERFEDDLKYVSNVNIFTDIKIFFMTIKVVLTREGVDSEGMVGHVEYGDQLLNEGRITREEYDAKMSEAKGRIEEYEKKHRSRANS